MNKTDMIIELGQTLTKGCMAYYDLVNDSDDYNICVGMSVDVIDSNTGAKYRYNIKIEKEKLENE